MNSRDSYSKIHREAGGPGRGRGEHGALKGCTGEQPVTRTSPSLSPASASPLAELVEVQSRQWSLNSPPHQDLSNWPGIFQEVDRVRKERVLSSLKDHVPTVRASCLQKGPLLTPRRPRAQGPSCTAAGQPSLPASRFQLEGTQLVCLSTTPLPRMPLKVPAPGGRRRGQTAPVWAWPPPRQQRWRTKACVRVF